ncbi:MULTISPECIES: hypothetical protein [Desulfitobacterium]|uniref:Uncharacterized protein n=1 Tax=Desulfitobacterium dehalogenans (strain ATCC 51507 / DSM 9161 / JW/IU-DC1) TaxID=756499 RepID=I4A8V6_DESDJ|nr:MULTISPECIES: hypothetical protein [Desulfitobacterium]AFM00391.1 hypothetical protein Desde_2004 [Desulfitobacterium dehalogenans ATCC 51507]
MTGSTLTILLSFGTGILSLVGLMSIFISMNSQHNVQRSREILWTLAALPYERNLFHEKGSIGKEVFRHFIIYEQIINQKHGFSKIIIQFAQYALGFCILIWTTMGFSLMFSERPLFEKIFIFSGWLLTVSFTLYFILKIFEELKSTSKVGRLPAVEEIVDADRVNSGISVVTLAAISSCIRMVDSRVYLGFPLPFKNLRINLSFFDSKEGGLPDIGSRLTFKECMESYTPLDPEKFEILEDDYCWYLIKILDHHKNGHKDSLITLEVLSLQGLVTVEFYIEEFSGQKNTSLNIYPYSFEERFINRVSTLDPFSINQIKSSTEVKEEVNSCLN